MVVLKCALAVCMAVISGHSKIDKAKILTSKCSLMKIKVIAECPHGWLFGRCVVCKS